MIASPRTYFFTGRLLASTQTDRGREFPGAPHPVTIGGGWSIYETEFSLDTGK
jgi:hypothetical protein